MGKNLIQQRRGKGSPTFRAKSFNFFKARNKTFGKEASGRIMDIIHCPGHTAPLMKVKYEDGEETVEIAPEGVRVNDEIAYSKTEKTGNTLQLADIPLGTPIYNIESKPGDGGKFCRAAGTFAKIVAKTEDKVIVLLPSKKQREFLPECRASIGIVAGTERLEKPLLKAGMKFYKMRALNKFWPKARGLAMNAVAHPFGGSRKSKKNKPTLYGKNTPPGAKAGMPRPTRTGRRKR